MAAARPFTHLAELEALLARGASRWSPAFRRGHAAYLESLIQPDGGFRGRAGESDLYYTSFALRGLDLLGADDSPAWPRAAEYLAELVRASAAGRSGAARDIIECFCLLHAAGLLARRGLARWTNGDFQSCERHCAEVLRACETPNGAWARRPGGPASLHHTFLAAQCRRLLRAPADARAAAALPPACDDGGFSDLGASPRGETNPTAAAALLMLAADAAEERLRAAGDFLLHMQRPEGGFAAHADAPLADLLSTFTAMVALAALGRLREAQLGDLGRFTAGLRAPGGGFRGAALHDEPDAEYTFYGLAAVALLTQLARARSGLPSLS